MNWVRTLMGAKQCILVIAYTADPDTPTVETFKSRAAMTSWVSTNLTHDEPIKPWSYFWEFVWVNGRYRCTGSGERK